MGEETSNFFKQQIFVPGVSTEGAGLPGLEEGLLPPTGLGVVGRELGLLPPPGL